MSKPTPGLLKENKYGSLGTGKFGTEPIVAKVEPFYGDDLKYGDHSLNRRQLMLSWNAMQSSAEALGVSPLALAEAMGNGKLEEIVGAMVEAVGHLTYMKEKLPHTNARHGLERLRAALALFPDKES